MSLETSKIVFQFILIYISSNIFDLKKKFTFGIFAK